MKFIKNLLFASFLVLMVASFGCDSVDDSSSGIPGPAPGGGTGTGGGSGGSTSPSGLPATLPDSFNGVSFDPVGDVLGNNLIGLTFLPGGNLIVISKTGQIYYLDSGFNLVGSDSINVHSGGDRGLLTVVADPDYTNNSYIFLYFTNPDGITNEVRRYTVDTSTDFTLEDEQAIISFPKDAGAYTQYGTENNGGGMIFNIAEELFIGVGDGGEPGGSDRDLLVAQNVSQTLGKIHRIVPNRTDFNGGFTTPVDNQSGTIYAPGVRNPATLIQKEKDDQFIGEFGGEFYHEICCLYNPGENFGWPWINGNEFLSGLQPAAYGYANGDRTFADQDPELNPEGQQGVRVLFFIEDPDFYGNLFERRLLYTDYYEGWVRALKIETNHTKTGDDPIGHQIGLGAMSPHPSNNTVYVVSNQSNRVLQMNLIP